MEFGTLLVTCSAIDFAQERTVTGVVWWIRDANTGVSVLLKQTFGT
jgi:hypothetical protein